MNVSDKEFAKLEAEARKQWAKEQRERGKKHTAFDVTWLIFYIETVVSAVALVIIALALIGWRP